MRVYSAGQKRGVTEQIKREMKRRSAVEPVIGHLKDDHRMDRNFLARRQGDAANAVLAAVGYNFSRLLRWFASLLHAWIWMLATAVPWETQSVLEA
jgi:transposase, IS5 family